MFGSKTEEYRPVPKPAEAPKDLKKAIASTGDTEFTTMKDI